MIRLGIALRATQIGIALRATQIGIALRATQIGIALLATQIGVALFALLGSAGPALGQGCAMCSSALGGPQDPLARAISWSVLFLMAAPYVIVGVVGGWLVYMHRRTPGRHRAAIIDLARSAARLRSAPPGDHSGGDVS